MPTVTPDKFDAVLFDLDGVITGTAKIHAAAWKQAFDEFLEKRAGNKPFKPFDKQLDYEDYVDGKSRYDGAQSFLESRHTCGLAVRTDSATGNRFHRQGFLSVRRRAKGAAG